MRRLLPLLLCALLLAGCRGKQLPTTAATQPTQTPTTAAATPQPTPQPTPVLSLPEQGVPVEGQDNLYRIGNETVASLDHPEVALIGDSLLLSEYAPTMEQSLYRIRKISIRDGSLEASADIPADGAVELCVSRDAIILLDEAGKVHYLDEDLTVTRSITLPEDISGCYLNDSHEELFLIRVDSGISRYQLATGEETAILDNAANVRCLGSSPSHLLVRYDSLKDRLAYTVTLNLSTGSMESLPVDGALEGGLRSFDLWILSYSIGGDEMIFATEESLRTASCKGRSLPQVLSPGGMLLITTDTGRSPTIYSREGEFLSSCSPEGSAHLQECHFAYSGQWRGIFFTDSGKDGCQLYFWDTEAPCSGEDLVFTEDEPVQPVRYLVDQHLYTWAEELTERYGPVILIAEQCSPDYSHYSGQVLEDPAIIRYNLQLLEDTLALYPEGFFRQLPCGHRKQIRIELVSELMAKADSNLHNAGAFVQARDDHFLMVLDGYGADSGTLFHEFSHIIDDHLEWDAMLDETALFSEEKWLSLQPEGFNYAYSYGEKPEEVMQYASSGYFTQDYALTNPTEDRATMMEAFMSGSGGELLFHPGLQAKMDYYARCIRDCFNTEGWPEETLWEVNILNKETGD